MPLFPRQNSNKLRVTFTGRPLGPHAANRLVAQIRARLVARIRVTFGKLGVTVQKLRVTPRKLRVTLSGIRGHIFEFGGPLDCSQEVDVVIRVIRLHYSTGSLPTIFGIASGLLKGFCPKRYNQQHFSKLKWGVQEEDSAAKLRFPWDSCLPARLTGLLMLCKDGCKTMSEDVPLAATWHRHCKSQASLARIRRIKIPQVQIKM